MGKFLSSDAWKALVGKHAKDKDFVAAVNKPGVGKSIDAWETAVKGGDPDAVLDALDEVDQAARKLRKAMAAEDDVVTFADGLLKEVATERKAAEKVDDDAAASAQAAKAEMAELEKAVEALCATWRADVTKALKVAHRAALAASDQLGAGIAGLRIPDHLDSKGLADLPRLISEMTKGCKVQDDLAVGRVGPGAIAVDARRRLTVVGAGFSGPLAKFY